MTRLSWKQLLLAVAVGAVFAALQGDPPVKAMRRLASLTCSTRAC
jgi:hypothetical protein